MRKIVLGLSLLLMLVQNGFAASDEEYYRWIKKTNLQWKKQALKCEMLANNHRETADINECTKAVVLMENSYSAKAKKFLPDVLSNTGVLYYSNEKNYIKAYEYLTKAVKLGNAGAQRNLNILCRNHSWVCK